LSLSPAKLRLRRIKVATFALGLVPLLLLGVSAVRGKLGVNPVDTVLNRLGWWTLVTLLASLACTPLKLLAGWNWPIQIRRMAGLFAFFYGSVHLLTYLVVDQGLDVGEIVRDVLKHKFVLYGLTAWLLLLPLALTSTDGSVRRLGFKRWKALHRLAYAAGVFGCIHFLMKGKVIEAEPVLFGVALAALLGVRVVNVRFPLGKLRRAG
jgi:sulfoxide reductase heme-binding subunit YedZ